MNEAVNIVFGNGFRYPFWAFDMYIFKIEVPKDIISTGRLEDLNTRYLVG